MSGRTRKANRYVKSALCQAAWAASHTKDTYLSAFYHRLQVRKGAPKAVMALAHHKIAIVYNVLARSEEYVELGGDYYDQRSKPKVVSRLPLRRPRPCLRSLFRSRSLPINLRIRPRFWVHFRLRRPSPLPNQLSYLLVVSAVGPASVPRVELSANTREVFDPTH